jgi:hypothetical protein
MTREFKAGQVWRWAHDEREELHLLLWESFHEAGHSTEWRTLRLDCDSVQLWTASFMLFGEDVNWTLFG